MSVRIKNLLNQSVRVSLQKPGQRLVEVTLPPHGAIPSAKNPTAIAEEDVTIYTRGLAKAKRVRVSADV